MPDSNKHFTRLRHYTKSYRRFLEASIRSSTIIIWRTTSHVHNNITWAHHTNKLHRRHTKKRGNHSRDVWKIPSACDLRIVCHMANCESSPPPDRSFFWWRRHSECNYLYVKLHNAVVEEWWPLHFGANPVRSRILWPCGFDDVMFFIDDRILVCKIIDQILDFDRNFWH